jgi:histidinol-phosphate aminotransferase
MSGPRFNPDLLKVPLYIAGKSADELREDLGLEEIVKLASNESPIGPSPQAIEAATQLLDQAHRYPGLVERNLRRKLAARLGPALTEQNIVVGNGGSDVLRMITQAFVFDGGNTVMCRATFPLYQILTTTFGGRPQLVEPTRDYRHDLEAMAACIDADTRLVYLCSPNNPTGHVITQAEAEEFLARVPDHVVVVFDEAYHDYVTDAQCVDTLAYVESGRNVFSLRSFSKGAGLANFRVGYAIGRPELADYVRRTQLPFQTGGIALSAAAASLDDEAYHTRQRQVVLEEREYLSSALHKLNLDFLLGQANFVTIVDPPLPVAALVEALLRQGIIVRPLAAFGLPDAVRVTIGTHEENVRFVQALKIVLERELKRA